MKRNSLVIVCLIILFSQLIPLKLCPAAINKSVPEDNIDLNLLHIPFIANNGQNHPDVSFYTQIPNGTYFVTRKGEMLFSFQSQKKNEPCSIREELINANINKISGEQVSSTHVSYFRGNNPGKWYASVPTFDYVAFGEIYDHIELKLHAHRNSIEKLFTVKPGGDPQNIKIKTHGANSRKITIDGKLSLETPRGTIFFTKPIAYQTINKKKKFVEIAYLLTTDGYSFTIGNYNTNKDLIIDPVLQSTYLGGSGAEEGWDLAVHPSTGHVYVTGETSSADFPGAVLSAELNFSGGNDAFVARVQGDLTGDSSNPNILSVAYIGGGGNDGGRGLAVTNDSVYVTGFRQVMSGNDVFIAKLSTDLTTLNAIRIFGGSTNSSEDPNDEGEAVAVDSVSGNVYVAGRTCSSDFTVTSGLFQTTRGGFDDAFIARFDSDLNNYIGTYLGGSGNDKANDIALKYIPDGGDLFVFVVGYTGYDPPNLDENDFPIISGGAQETFGGQEDAFAARLSSDLSSVTHSTYIGGGGIDQAHALTLSNNRIYVAGQTYWDQYNIGSSLIDSFTRDPDGVGPLGPEDLVGIYSEMAGSQDTFIASLALDLSLNADTRITYYGGNHHDRPYDLALHPTLGRLYVMGTTQSYNLPGTAGGAQSSRGGVYIARFTSDLEGLDQATYLGGIYDETRGGLELYPKTESAQVYVSGHTLWDEFPETDGAVLNTLNGSSDAFVALFDAQLMAPTDADIDVHPLSLNFANTVQGATSDLQAISIENIGANTLNISNIEIIGSTDFAFDSGTCGETIITIPPFFGCSIDVSFTPSLSGEQTDILRITSDDPDEGTVDVDLAGISVPDIKILPGNPGQDPFVQFSQTFVGSSSLASMSIQNEGGAELSITEPISLIDDNFSLQFGGASGGCPSSTPTLAPGEYCRVDVTYSPQDVGEHSADVTIRSNDPDEDPVTVHLNGTGIAVPEAPLTANDIDIGIVPLGDQGSGIISLHNEGPALITITGYTLSNPTDFDYDAAFDFSFGCDGDMMNNSLYSGAVCGIEITFNPTYDDSFCETFTISYRYIDDGYLELAELTVQVFARTEEESDGDCIRNADDNCPFINNPDQLDFDSDGQGDACDCDDVFQGPDETDIDCGGPCVDCTPCTWCGPNIEPIRIRGYPSLGYIDIVYVPHNSWQGLMPDFIERTKELIRETFFQLDNLTTVLDNSADPNCQSIEPIPFFYKDKFNFYYDNSGMFGEDDLCAGELPNDEEWKQWLATCSVACSPLTLFIGCTCLDYEPETFWKYASFADVGAIIRNNDIHTDNGGCAYPMGPPTGTGSHFIAGDDVSLVSLHEAGHALFGLIDEYVDNRTVAAGGTYYDHDLQYHYPHSPANVWKDFGGFWVGESYHSGSGVGWCQDFANDHCLDPTGDGETTGCRPFVNPDGIPYIRFDALNTLNLRDDIMDNARATDSMFREADSWVINDVFNNWPSGSTRGILTYVYFDGVSFSPLHSEVVNLHPDVIEKVKEFTVQVFSSDNILVHEYGISDPRYAYDDEGSVFYENVIFPMNIAFFDNVRKIDFRDTDSLELIGTIDLAPALYTFCYENAYQPIECTNIDLDNNGVKDVNEKDDWQPALASQKICENSQSMQCLSMDGDGDGALNEDDNCPSTPNPDQNDSDQDSAGDACDICPEDPNKTQEGVCGCNVPDTDTDHDNTPDCIDDGDSDGDGFSDREEVVCGSDPAEITSRCTKGLPWIMLLLDD